MKEFIRNILGWIVFIILVPVLWVIGGYSQKGELGYATNSSYCEGYNQALSDLKELIEKM